MVLFYVFCVEKPSLRAADTRQGPHDSWSPQGSPKTTGDPWCLLARSLASASEFTSLLRRQDVSWETWWEIRGNLIKSRWFNYLTIKKMWAYLEVLPKWVGLCIKNSCSPMKSGDVPQKNAGFSITFMWIPQESGHHWDHMAIHQRISVWPSPGGWSKLPGFWKAHVYDAYGYIWIYMEWWSTSALSRLAYGKVPGRRFQTILKISVMWGHHPKYPKEKMKNTTH